MVGIAALVAMVLGFAMKWRKRQKTQKEGSGLEEDDGDQEIMGRRNFVYDMDVLVAATDNFCLANQLGAGGFGIVYKVMLILTLAPGLFSFFDPLVILISVAELFYEYRLIKNLTI